MFTVKKRYGSIGGLPKNQPMTQRISIKKQSFHDHQTIKGQQNNQKTSRILPQINLSNKPNDTMSKISTDTLKQNKSQLKQLSLAINKYYKNRVEFLKNPFNEFCYDIMSVVQSFSHIDNNFQQLFKLIYEDIKCFIFMTQNAELKSKYRLREGQIYRKAILDIEKISTKSSKQLYEKLAELTDAKEEIQQQLQRKELLWQQSNRKHLEEIQWYKKICNKEYVTYLQEKVKSKEQRIQELQESQKSLVRLRDQYEKQLSKQTNIIDQQIKQIAKLKTFIYDFNITKQQTQKLILKLKDRFDQINLKIIGIKQIIQTVQNQNQSLKNQRLGLVKRAAVTFQQLTPRPKYQKIIKFTQNQEGKKLKSTSQITEFLFSYIGKNMSEDKILQGIFDQKVSLKKQMHPKLQQASKIRNETGGLIQQSKRQIKEVLKILRNNQFS